MASPFSWDKFGERTFSIDDNSICEICWKWNSDKGIKNEFYEGSTNLYNHGGGKRHRVISQETQNFDSFQKKSNAHCHRGKYLNLVCLNHLEPICVNVDKELHAECQVKSFGALRKVNRKERDVLLNQTSQMRVDVLKTMEHKEKDISDQKANALKMDKDYWHRIQTQVNRWKRMSKKDIHEVFNTEVKRLHDAVNKIMEMLSKLEKSILEIHTNSSVHRQVGCHNELPDMITEVNQAAKKVHKPIKEFEIPDYLTSFECYVNKVKYQATKSVDDKDVSFKGYVSDANREATQSVDNKGGIDISSLSDSVDLETDSGNFGSCDDNIKQAFINKVALEEHANQVGSKDDATKDIQHTTARRTDSLYVKTEEDHDDCCITGMSVCENGNLLLVDCYNKQLKLYSLYGDYIASVVTPGEPYDVTVSNIGDVAVSMWMNQKEIVLIDVYSNTLNIHGCIKLRNRIYGIAAIEDDFVISCDDKIPSVRRVTRSGFTKWELSFGTDGRKVFKAPGYLVTNAMNHGHSILVSDTERDCIVILDGETGTLVKILPQSKAGPLGLTIDNFGHVYVGYRYDAGIRIWSSNMADHKTILSSGKEIKRPQAVAFNQLSGELLISSWRCNAVERFKIIHN